MAVNRVRDMYGTEDVTDMPTNERKTIRDNHLDANPDVVFKVYSPVFPTKQDKLCALLFRPSSDPVKWMTFIIETYKKSTAQWTHRKNPLPARNVIKISGQKEELQTFCNRFEEHLQQINGNEIEELAEGAQQLQLND